MFCGAILSKCSEKIEYQIEKICSGAIFLPQPIQFPTGTKNTGPCTTITVGRKVCCFLAVF